MNRLVVVAALFVITASVDAQSDEERLAIAKEAYRLGKYDEAVNQTEILLEGNTAKDKTATAAREIAVAARHRRGAERFRNARIASSIRDFDREIELAPEREPQHWQRGIAYYYSGEYEKGVKQFELHRTVNPEDVENAVWHFLCVVRTPEGSVDKARKNLIPVGGDDRIPMKEVHKLFAGTATPEDVLKAAKGAGADAEFHGDLYVGLYYEAIGKEEESLRFLQRAAENPSAQEHTMGDVARVHVKLRKSQEDNHLEDAKNLP